MSLAIGKVCWSACNAGCDERWPAEARTRWKATQVHQGVIKDRKGKGRGTKWSVEWDGFTQMASHFAKDLSLVQPSSPHASPGSAAGAAAATRAPRDGKRPAPADGQPAWATFEDSDDSSDDSGDEFDQDGDDSRPASGGKKKRSQPRNLARYEPGTAHRCNAAAPCTLRVNRMHLHPALGLMQYHAACQRVRHAAPASMPPSPTCIQHTFVTACTWL